MKETDFIRQNRQKWQAYEKILSAPKADPDELGKIFVEITDDLSFARTHYRNRSVRVFLNGMAQRIYQTVYTNRKKSMGGFWTRELPLAMFNCRREMLVCTILFVLSIGVGMFSGLKDAGFAAVILGEDYVQMTEDNISKGDPMAVYKSMPPVEMFIEIATNNLRVSLLTFIMGAFFSIGTLMILMYNGIMVGAFLHFFIARDLSSEALITVFQHGTIELCFIVLAGTAGLTLGKGLVYPGTYTRQQALLISARRGIRIMAGISPYIIFAAIIESFATRLTDLPDLIRLTLILLSALLMLGYYVWLPFRLYGKTTSLPAETYEEPRLVKRAVPEVHKIRNSAAVFTDTMWLFRKNLAFVVGFSAIASLIAVLSIGLVKGFDFHSLFKSDLPTDIGGPIELVLQAFIFPSTIAEAANYLNNFWLLAFNAFCSVVLFRYALNSLAKDCIPEWKWKHSYLILLSISALAIHATFIFPLFTNWALLLITLGLMLPVVSGTFLGKGPGASFKATIYGLQLAFSSLLLITLFQLSGILLVNTPFSYFLLNSVLMNFSSESWASREFEFAYAIFFAFFCLHMFLFLSFSCSVFIIGILSERIDAKGIKAKIAAIQKKSNAYGLERE
jgi:uncharacterized membrane protein SpoIIM required for sporulation